ncbi:hypothetical protein JIX56_26545 [Streptomyces sp. CA-210063]|uniref:hypothetical protein n=1 Tax=Streptomyces sp. CA-210063 TaxID=2801029 RepID=UPI00214C07C4|nr:hypothetical protein [Streptomyces sp. CA-210063]UUU33142.1 hypothetical protein JIX56_26545 [Streptomyces sp. CA-210063]
MQSRHVRAIAVFGIAVFALTGARGSSGGGCSGGSSSSSSSSSSGGSDSGSTTTTGGSTTTGTGGTSSSKGAARDLKIESCEYDNGLVARVRATNRSSASTYTYRFEVEFTDTDGKSVATTEGGVIRSVPAGSSEVLNVKVIEGSVDDSAFAARGGTCKLTDLSRTAE